MPVARRIVDVAAAAQVRASTASMQGSCGAIGDGGTCGSGSTMCSPAHSDSKPSVSAVRATPAMRSGDALAPMLMLNRPSFTTASMTSGSARTRLGVGAGVRVDPVRCVRRAANETVGIFGRWSDVAV